MKRLSAGILALLCALSLLLSGCTDDNNAEVVGEWAPSTVSIGGVQNDGTYTFNETSVDVQYGGKSQKLSFDAGILTLKLTYHNQTTSYMFTKVVK